MLQNKPCNKNDILNYLGYASNIDVNGLIKAEFPGYYKTIASTVRTGKFKNFSRHSSLTTSQLSDMLEKYTLHADIILGSGTVTQLVYLYPKEFFLALLTFYHFLLNTLPDQANGLQSMLMLIILRKVVLSQQYDILDEVMADLNLVPEFKTWILDNWENI